MDKPGKQRTKTTSFRLPPDLMDRVRAAAVADRRTLGKAVEVGLELYIQKVEAETGKSLAAA